MKVTDTPERFIELTERLKLRAPYMVANVDWATMFCLIAQVQLALRHPANKGYAAQVAREFCDHLIATVEKHIPELAELLKRGYDPRFDDRVKPPGMV